MTKQLKLIDTSEVDWKLDERTKEIGRRGLAAARAALRDAITRPSSAGDQQATAA